MVSTILSDRTGAVRLLPKSRHPGSSPESPRHTTWSGWKTCTSVVWRRESPPCPPPAAAVRWGLPLMERARDAQPSPWLVRTRRETPFVNANASANGSDIILGPFAVCWWCTSWILVGLRNDPRTVASCSAGDGGPVQIMCNNWCEYTFPNSMVYYAITILSCHNTIVYFVNYNIVM